MPIYSFICHEEDGGCGQMWELVLSLSDNLSKSKCPNCQKTKPVGRNYFAENTYLYDGSPKTVGSLADKNTTKMSRDQRHEIYMKNTEYRRQPFQGELPEGASLYPRDNEGNIIPSTKTSKKPRKHAPQTK